LYRLKEKIKYSEVNSWESMTFAALADYMQDCARIQSDAIEKNMSNDGGTWIVASMEVVVNRMPKLSENVSIETWPSLFKGFSQKRSFCMFDENEEKIVFANSNWIYVDKETKKPVAMPKELVEIYAQEIYPVVDYAWSNTKIQTEGVPKSVKPIEVMPFFIDCNKHMNNGKYVMLAEGLLKEGIEVSKMRVEYRKQALLGDVLYPIMYEEPERITIVFQDIDKIPFAIVQCWVSEDRCIRV